ncbi:spo11/DNA topoisomerase VI, subunit A protein isoform X2 [Wolffia australiana]
MAGRTFDSNAPEVISKIKGLVRFIIAGVGCGRLPTVEIDRYITYCTDSSGECHCNPDLSCGKKTLSFYNESQAQRLIIIFRVLGIVRQLLQENRHASKRDIYYMHPSLFSEQTVVDSAIKNICILLQCSRHNLNVVPAGKGLMMGWLRFTGGDRIYDCIKKPNSAYPIPVHVEEIEGLVSAAQYILVVEKETVFKRLANDKFCSKNRCIVITGRGYPDVSTRRFLKHLVENIQLPVYCLVDCDPYGIDILMTYKFGSTQMAFDARLMCVPEVYWLGVLPSDQRRYSLPDRCLLPLSPEDEG